MKGLKDKLIFWLPIVLPVLLIFKNIFFGRLPTWGDAPFFYPEGLRELFSEPLVWVQRGTSFGGINLLLWLSPLMYLFGLLHRVFSLGSDALVRIVFYLPSLVLAVTGPYFLTRYLRTGKVVSFFASLFYVLNTYFILLIDGGQVGIALSYGLFPWIIFFGKRVLAKPDVNSFFLFLFSSFVLTIVDPRICFVAFFSLFIWQLTDYLFLRTENLKNLGFLLLVGVLLVTLNLYWLYPVLKLKVSGLGSEVTSLQLSSLLNSLLLYAPHWPSNVFGKVVPPIFYFAFWPILIFGGILIGAKNKKQISLLFCFLAVAFMAKGSTPPLGGIYNFLVNKYSFGSVFRDSSKFFIPLMLWGGMLIGEVVNSYTYRFRLKILPVSVYVFLLFCLYPAFSGKMNFILSNRKAGSDFQIIYEQLKGESGFFRTAWFPEKHPLAFETMDKPALDARGLAAERPFAAMNASEDVFNFLNNSEYVNWLKVLGVKYLFLSGDPRNIFPTKEDVKDWNTLQSLVAQTPGLIKKDWGTSFPVYEVPDVLPHAYAVKQLIAVVGPDLSLGGNLPVPSLYFEDGKFNPADIVGKNSDSVKILFNGKGALDLSMSYLQKFFKAPTANIGSDWAVYSSDQYLKTKYELLIRGFIYRDFDYGKGLAFSTKIGEKVTFQFNVPQSGDYILAKRWGTIEKQNLYWTTEERNLSQGNFNYEVSNSTGFEVLNTVALVPKEDFIKAQGQADALVKHFGIITKAVVTSDNPLSNNYWLVYSDNYDKEWKLVSGTRSFDPVPVYSMVNGFYVEPGWDNLHLEYVGQATFRYGVWISAFSFLLLTATFIFLRANRNGR